MDHRLVKTEVLFLIMILHAASLHAQSLMESTKVDSMVRERYRELNGQGPITLIPDTLTTHLSRAEAATKSIAHKIDSLRSLNLPTDKYRKKLDSISDALKNKISLNQYTDSLNLKIKNGTANISQARDSLTTIIEQRRFALQKLIDRKTSFLDSLKQIPGMPDFNTTIPDPLKNITTPSIPTMDVNLSDKIPTNNIKDNIPTDITPPNLDIQTPQNPLTDIQSKVKVDDKLQDINSQVKEFTDKPKSIIQDNDLMKEVNNAKGQIQKVNQTAQQIETYGREIKDIKENGFTQADTLAKVAEKMAVDRIMKHDAMNELQVQNKNMAASRNMLEQYQDMLAAVRDKKEATAMAKDLANENLKDPFLGQEEKLKAGVAQLDKLKKKYKSIPDSRYLPKRVPNEMKGKPFRERIVPGVSLQMFKSDRTAIDFQPYFAYKLSGRFRPGIGASWRHAVWLKKPWMQKDEVYGVRVFNDLRLHTSFYFHTEGEWLHFSEPAKVRYKFPADKDFGEWRFRFNAGLFRTYPINKRLNGQFQILYNIADLTRFPQNKNTSVRFGFEYIFQPKKR